MNDHELLRSFRETGSEESFRELVQRHLGMVYSVALRRVRNADWADEVAHAVFIALARKAASLSDRTMLAGWLYRATRFAAGKLLRDEERRARHEKEAAMVHMNHFSAEQEEISWEELSPLVFEMLDALGGKDREAILLRFIENRGFAEVAAAMGVTEAAAKMRTGRALEKLRERLAKRGVSVVLVTLSSGLTVVARENLPAGLIASVSATAVGQAAVAASAMSLAGSVLSAFRWAKLKLAAAGAGLVLAGIVIGVSINSLGRATGSLTVRPDDIARRDGWVVDGRNVRSEPHQGQEAVYFDGQPGRGITWRDGLTFSEGVIEADIASFTGHMGIAFWVRDSQNYSAVYFRPQNRPEDPVAGGRGVQYVALPDYSWQRLRQENPGVYENSASLPMADSGAWFHVRLEVSPAQVRAFINNALEPCLVVSNPLTTNTTGSVGLFMGDGSLGVFSNLKIRPGP